jgi:hypothetical protein
MKKNQATQNHAKLFYVRPEARKQIEEMAAALNCSHSEAIRHAVKVFLQQKADKKGDHQSSKCSERAA